MVLHKHHGSHQTPLAILVCRHQSNMPVNINSTFADVSPLDKAALYVPHWLYSSRLDSQVLTFTLMILVATTLVIVGSYATVSQPKLASDPVYDRHTPLWDPTDRDGSSLYLTLPEDVETLNGDLIDFRSVLLLPVLAGSALYGLDYLIRLFDLQKIKLLNYYVTAMVAPSTYVTVSYLFTVLLRNLGYALGLKHNLGYFFRRYRLTLSTDDKLPLGVIEQFDLKKMKMNKNELREFESWMLGHNNTKLIKLHKIDAKKQKITIVWDAKFVFVTPIALFMLCLFYYHNPSLRADYGLTKINWIANNLVAFAFAITGVKVTRVGNFKVATLLLVALFAYDIYFVFGSTLMLSVAQGLELPVKIVIPTAPLTMFSFSEIQTKALHQLKLSSSILGLGDVVVPATFASLCLRFDYFQYYERTNLPFHHLRCIGVPKYFITAISGYVSGLILTVVANQYSGHGQPALLYLVPCLLLSVFAVAKWNGDVSKVWKYSEEMEEFTKEKTEDVNKSAVEESPEPEIEVPSMHVVLDEVMYEFEITEDETDDTYIIEEDTDEDEELFEVEDLTNEIDYLIRDQQEEQN